MSNHIPNDHLTQWDRDHFFHASTSLGQFARGELDNRIITSAEGVYIRDREGRQLLDGFSGLYCVNAGYGQQSIIDAISAQANELAYYHAYVGHGTEASITLAKMIADRAPEGLNHTYFGLSGSDANETNIKLVWYYNNILNRPEKKKLISRWRGYHGSGVMTGSLTGLAVFHNKFDLPMAPIIHTEAPYYYRRPAELEGASEQEFSQYCAEQLEKLILAEGSETIAAMIGEPVLGTGGLVPPPEGYWPAIQAVLDKYDILLIADEVITGFGRTGQMFASAKYGMKPDLITIAKGLTSAYAPLSGSVVSDRMYEVLMQGSDEFGAIGHGWTYSAHPLGAAAGVANLSLIDEHNLISNVNEIGPYLTQQLRSAIGSHDNVGEIRGVGMMSAIELVEKKSNRRFYSSDDKIAAKVVAEMLNEGVIARAMPHSDVIGLAPPFCLSHAEADQIVQSVTTAMQRVLG